MSQSLDVLRGTLDLLILKALSWGPKHGLGVLLWIHEVSGQRLQVEEGALYPSLHRMEKRHWLDAEWGTSDMGRRAKFYSLTRAGRTRLKTEVRQWSEFSAAVSKVLLSSTAG